MEFGSVFGAYARVIIRCLVRAPVWHVGWDLFAQPIPVDAVGRDYDEGCDFPISIEVGSIVDPDLGLACALLHQKRECLFVP